MLVRVQIGRNAGQIQDIEISAAKGMIADGRATAVEYENGAETEGVAQLIDSEDSTNSAKSTKPPRKK